MLFLVLGALTYARNAAAISSVFGRSTASSQLTSAYNTLAVDEHSFVVATQSCLSSSDTLTCVETADNTVADELSSFADSVANISFPASASSQAAALVATARTAVSDMRQVASAPDAATYQQLATSSGLQQSLSRVDTDYSALVNTLA